jgi:hypothetical protein
MSAVVPIPSASQMKLRAKFSASARAALMAAGEIAGRSAMSAMTPVFGSTSVLAWINAALRPADGSAV